MNIIPPPITFAEFAADATPRIGLEVADIEVLSDAAEAVTECISRHVTNGASSPDAGYIEGELDLIDALLDAQRRAIGRLRRELNSMEEMAISEHSDRMLAA